MTQIWYILLISKIFTHFTNVKESSAAISNAAQYTQMSYAQPQ